MGDLLWLALPCHRCGPELGSDGHRLGEKQSTGPQKGGRQWGAGLEGLLCIFQPASQPGDCTQSRVSRSLPVRGTEWSLTVSLGTKPNSTPDLG